MQLEQLQKDMIAAMKGISIRKRSILLLGYEQIWMRCLFKR